MASTNRPRLSLRRRLSRMEDEQLLLQLSFEEVPPPVEEASWLDEAVRAEVDHQEEEVVVHNQEAEQEVGAAGSFLSPVEAGEVLVLARKAINRSNDLPAPHRCSSSNDRDPTTPTDGHAWSDRDRIRAIPLPAVVLILLPLLHLSNPTPVF